MKNIIPNLLISVVITSFALGVEKIDVIQLKNGDVFKGIIIENIPNDYIRLELQGGSILTYQYTDIETLLKETKESKSAPLTQSSSMTYSRQMLTYQNQKRSQGSAVISSIILPTAGHAYAGNWGRGLLFFATEIGLLILANTAGIDRECETYTYNRFQYSSSGNYEHVPYSYVQCSRKHNPLFFVGIAGSIVTRLIEIIDAGKEVKRFNLKLYNRLFLSQSDFGLNIRPHKDGANLLLAYNF